MATPTLELDSVHAVYEAVADHFSHTRYKPWRVVSDFLLGLPAGSLVLDAGCGNGKNMAVNPDLYVLGVDRCHGLLRHAAERGLEVVLGDAMTLPHASARFDAAMSIAVIHHMSTADRRRDAVAELLRVVRGGGRVLIYVWAMEDNSRIARICGPDLPSADVMVPWRSGDRVEHRFYHLFCENELEVLIRDAGGTVLESGRDSDNYFCVAQ